MPNTPPKANSRKHWKDPRRLYSWTKCRNKYKEQFYCCQRCQYLGTVDRLSYENLSIHHIERVFEAPHKVLDWSNLLTVCKACKIHFDTMERQGYTEQAKQEGWEIKGQ